MTFVRGDHFVDGVSEHWRVRALGPRKEQVNFCRSVLSAGLMY